VVKHGRPMNDSTFWYIDAVEEALCFGWIDITGKKISDGVVAHRFSHRSPKSLWSELNKEHARRMEKLGKMADAGRAVLPDTSLNGCVIDSDILKAFKADELVYQIFLSFPSLYQHVRIDTIQINKKRLNLFQSRLQKIIENTKQGI
jgi:hypothetical protein